MKGDTSVANENFLSCNNNPYHFQNNKNSMKQNQTFYEMHVN